MNKSGINILLVEDNESYARLIVKMLIERHNIAFNVQYTDTLAKAMEKLEKEQIEVIILDLILPDAQGLESFETIQKQNPEIPIVVLTAVADEEIAVKAVHEGAQDYLIKGSVEPDLLIRSLRYAIERQKMQMSLKSLSLLDDLTNLYNRRGFIGLAEQLRKLSIRKGRKFLVVFVDVDKLKKINDQFSHGEGDNALREAADILKETFRETDVIARIGGDEFAVLANEFSAQNPETITKRLNKNIIKHNDFSERQYPISISFGIAEFDPEQKASIDELLTEADKQMYEQKKKKF